jgi:hypothetical protein
MRRRLLRRSLIGPALSMNLQRPGARSCLASSACVHNLRIFHGHRDANACAFHEAFAAIDFYRLPALGAVHQFYLQLRDKFIRE